MENGSIFMAGCRMSSHEDNFCLVKVLMQVIVAQFLSLASRASNQKFSKLDNKENKI